MFYKVNKIVLNYQDYNKFLKLKSNKTFFIIKGFFGEISLKIPKGVVVRTSEDFIYLYFRKGSINVRKLKYFHNMIIFSFIGILYNHFNLINIKGIGYKFSFDKDNDSLLVYNGNSLPVSFKLPCGIKLLDNESLNNFTLLGSDYTILNDFSNNVRKCCMPNKYKEMGIFLEKKL